MNYCISVSVAESCSCSLAKTLADGVWFKVQLTHMHTCRHGDTQSQSQAPTHLQTETANRRGALLRLKNLQPYSKNTHLLKLSLSWGTFFKHTDMRETWGKQKEEKKKHLGETSPWQPDPWAQLHQWAVTSEWAQGFIIHLRRWLDSM